MREKTEHQWGSIYYRSMIDLLFVDIMYQPQMTPPGYVPGVPVANGQICVTNHHYSTNRMSVVPRDIKGQKDPILPKLLQCKKCSHATVFTRVLGGFSDTFFRTKSAVRY